MLYVLSIGPGTVFLMHAAPDAGLLESQTGYTIWQAMYEVPARQVPKPVRKPVMTAMNWYMGKCCLAYMKVRGPLHRSQRR